MSLVPKRQVFADRVLQVVTDLVACAHLQTLGGDFLGFVRAYGANDLLDLWDKTWAHAQALQPEPEQQRRGQWVAGHLPANAH